MHRDVAGWTAGMAGAGVLFYVADQRGWPLCGALRTIFHTQHPIGRIAFTAAYGTGAMILHRHVLNQVADAEFQPET